MLMKAKFVIPAALAAAVLGGAIAVAQEAGAYADASPVFAQLQRDTQGATADTIMHAPAGDVLAVMIGRTSHEIYTKEDQLLIVISGHGTANVGYPTYTLKPGSVLSVPRNTAFQITAAGTAPIKAYLVASPNYDPNDKRVLEQ